MFAFGLLQEWWDVKGIMRTFTIDTKNPDPFKANVRSPLRDLCLKDDCKYIRIDPAHTFAIDGVGKDFLASCIVVLARAGHFGGGPIARGFDQAYARFIAYCAATNKSTSIGDFGFGTFKLKENSFLVFRGSNMVIIALANEYTSSRIKVVGRPNALHAQVGFFSPRLGERTRRSCCWRLVGPGDAFDLHGVDGAFGEKS